MTLNKAVHVANGLARAVQNLITLSGCSIEIFRYCQKWLELDSSLLGLCKEVLLKAWNFIHTNSISKVTERNISGMLLTQSESLVVISLFLVLKFLEQKDYYCSISDWLHKMQIFLKQLWVGPTILHTNMN